VSPTYPTYRYRVTVIRLDGSSGPSVVVDAMDGRQAIAFAALERRRRQRAPRSMFLTEHARSAIAERVRVKP
jgi:hypothetical protein